MFLYISSLHPGWEPSRKMKYKSLPYPDSWHPGKIQNFSETIVITLILLHLNESIFCIFPGLVVAGTGHWTWSADWLLSKWLSINQTNTRMLTNQGPHNTSSCLQHQHIKTFWPQPQMWPVTAQCSWFVHGNCLISFHSHSNFSGEVAVQLFKQNNCLRDSGLPNVTT